MNAETHSRNATQVNAPTPAELAVLNDWLARVPARDEPDAMALAAWMDGGRDEDSASQIELWLALNPERLALFGALDENHHEPLVDAEIRRAQALVKAPTPDKVSKGIAWPIRMLGGTLGLATGAAGLAVGLGLAQLHAQAETQWLAALMAGLADLPGAW